MGVTISKGNSKMGSIPSVSLPAGLTCIGNCGCQSKCYAKKIERIRKNVRESYLNNLRILKEDSATYWREVEASIMMSRFFRFHVSGDIPNYEYLANMAAIASRNMHCEILCFTKKYDIVNRYICDGNSIPGNLHIIMSGWKGLEMSNPFNLPEAHVKYKDGTTTARDDAITCEGNCVECTVAGGGCWNLKNGEQVVFNEH